MIVGVEARGVIVSTPYVLSREGLSESYDGQA